MTGGKIDEKEKDTGFDAGNINYIHNGYSYSLKLCDASVTAVYCDNLLITLYGGTVTIDF